MPSNRNPRDLPAIHHRSLADRRKQTSGAWSDRVAALKNIPPVSILSGNRGQQSFSGISRIRIMVAFLPVSIAMIVRYSIDGVNHIRFHQPLPRGFWWLVAAEMGLAVLMWASFPARSTTSITCSPTGIASCERRGHAHQAAAHGCHRLPRGSSVFYDRLERARVQATDRLAMIQQMGRLHSADRHGDRVFSMFRLLFAGFVSPAHCGNRSCISWRKPFPAFPHLCEELPPERRSAGRWTTCVIKWAAAKEAAKRAKALPI